MGWFSSDEKPDTQKYVLFQIGDDYEYGVFFEAQDPKLFGYAVRWRGIPILRPLFETGKCAKGFPWYKAKGWDDKKSSS